MLPEFQRNSNIGVAAGIALHFAGRMLFPSGKQDAVFVFDLLALVAIIWGCSQYAQAKGHSTWFGALGILSVIGFVVLVLFPDKCKSGAPPAARPANKAGHRRRGR